MHAITHQSEVSALAPSRYRALLRLFDPGEPHPYRGPFARWPRITDAALAVVVFAGSLIAVAASALGDEESFTIRAISDNQPGAFAMLAVAAAALLWRRQHPIAVTAFLTTIMVGWAIAGYGDGQDLAIVVAIYAVGRYTADYRLSLVTVTIVIAISILGTLVDANQRVDIAPAIILGWLPWYFGHRIRNRGDYLALLQERAKRVEADQHARARQAVAEERSRIARELHDVVAHQVSMMTVQAGAAKTIARDDIEAAVDAIGDVERAGRQALGELRHLLGVLRPDTADSDDLGPQPGLADIPALADELASTGADVSLTIAPLPENLSAAVNLSAYRIVQESITNILKHAGPNPEAKMAIDFDDSAMVINITNTTKTAAPGLPASGYGIVGMRERATLLGGSLTACSRPPNRFCVNATIPLKPGRA